MLQAEARGTALIDARKLIAEFDLTADELFGKTRKSVSSPVAPKYKDPVSGATWTGRGKPPTWIKDKNRDDFLNA